MKKKQRKRKKASGEPDFLSEEFGMVFLIIYGLIILLIILFVALIGTAIVGLLGGTALAFAGKSLKKSEKRKPIAKVLTVLAVIFIVVGLAAAGVLVYFFLTH